MIIRRCKSKRLQWSPNISFCFQAWHPNQTKTTKPFDCNYTSSNQVFILLTLLLFGHILQSLKKTCIRSLESAFKKYHLVFQNFSSNSISFIEEINQNNWIVDVSYLTCCAVSPCVSFVTLTNPRTDTRAFSISTAVIRTYRCNKCLRKQYWL